MELKLENNVIANSANLCSNRTFMELKSRPCLYGMADAGGSNRTFMELK